MNEKLSFNPEEKVQTAEWVRPDVDSEYGELERTAEHLGIDMEKLVQAFNKAEIEQLTDEDWSQLDNADSSDSTWTLDAVRDWIEKRNEVQDDNDRDVDGIIAGFDEGASMQAPTVLFRPDDAPYLIGGNTRLLIARAKNIRPEVLAIRLDK